MSWLRVEGRMPQHKKVAPRTDAAFRLHLTAMAWCVEELTDGKVPFDVPQTLTAAPQGKRLQPVIDELVGAGLWERFDDHYLIHDFLDWNPRSDVVRANRDAARSRMQRLRSPDVRANNSRSSHEVRDSVSVSVSVSDPKIQPEPSDQRPVRLVPSEPPPPPPTPVDFTDSERMTLCPLDLHERARKFGVIAELANALKVDPDALFAEAEDYVSHQTLTAKKPGNLWMTRLRNQLRKKAVAGLLPAPGAIAHAANSPQSKGLPTGWHHHPTQKGWYTDESGATRRKLPGAA